MKDELNDYRNMLQWDLESKYEMWVGAIMTGNGSLAIELELQIEKTRWELDTIENDMGLI